MKYGTLSGRLLLIVALAISVPAFAGNTADDGERPTFYKDVMPILQENCQVCHREGGANFGGMYAPMAFTDYANVRPWQSPSHRTPATALCRPGTRPRDMPVNS